MKNDQSGEDGNYIFTPQALKKTIILLVFPAMISGINITRIFMRILAMEKIH